MTEQQLRQAIVDVALAHLGEKSKTCPQWIIDAYNECIGIYAGTVSTNLPRTAKMQPGYAYCAATVAACQYLAGAGKAGVYEMSCGQLIKIAKQRNIWLEDESKYGTPEHPAQIADIILYDWKDAEDYSGDDVNAPGHTGLVCAVNDNGTLDIIEGNYSSSIKKRTVKLNGRYQRGFICPNYASVCDPEPEDSQPTLLVLMKGAKGEEIKALQILLNGRIASKLTVDGSFGTKTAAAVRTAQKKYELTEDGICTMALWNRLLNG